MHPDEDCTKAGQPVINILHKKHPEVIVPDLMDEENATFEEYVELLETVPVDCDAEMVEEVASKLRGGAGPSGVDTIAMKNWLLRHGRALQVL